ncbi:hypothetical protein [Mucilaginibacter polytrichastri]|uniref:Uncharacterized protein n=1 Tax=Mucilaginibacter polytrichastri TaxID=1302689 RepID=A0A1Q5ZUD6_9SPHI|nr:hypothetical protein [Mucilaginibacter polytrichastri]OKS85391.1 hypothetical protein RG47T_0837 [Mucilaginibacter polytrichastri]SFS39658.1 hypothetical protein SAMN04487890_101258 [Mucilaginibacter polytrichastri]
MRNPITFLSLMLISAKLADAQSTHSDWHVPAPIAINNSDFKATQQATSQTAPGFNFIKLQASFAVLPPIPPVEPLSIPADLTRQTYLESENSTRVVQLQENHLQENAKEAQMVHPSCCCCCCCRVPIAVRKSANMRPKRKILASTRISQHKAGQHQPLKPMSSRNAILKPKTVKHRHVKRRLVRYIRYCPCTFDTSS